MKALVRRLDRLEGQLSPRSGPPRKRHSMMLRPTDGRVDLANSDCQRTLCADGSISEYIVLFPGENEITDGELEAWIESFPVETNPGHRPCRMPPPPESL